MLSGVGYYVAMSDALACFNQTLQGVTIPELAEAIAALTKGLHFAVEEGYRRVMILASDCLMAVNKLQATASC